jgi:TetR/AcrR family transcriptional regulator, transcriptional repressor for nem operon
MENRKTQIIDLALKLIKQKGYVAFSYDDISKQLGVTKASIHYHFEKKEDLGVAVAEGIFQRLQNLKLSITDSSLTVNDKLMLFIHKRAEQFTCTEICPISSLQADFESLPDIVRQKVEEVSRLELSIMNEIVAEARNKQSVSGLESIQSISLMILSSLKGVLIYRRVLGDDVLKEVLKEIDQFLKII